MNISLSYSPATLADFIGALAALRGTETNVTINPPTVAPTPSQAVPAPVTAEDKHGPNEARLLALFGLQRMRVPSEWTGTREDYAANRIAEHESNEAAKALAATDAAPVVSDSDIEGLH